MAIEKTPKIKIILERSNYDNIFLFINIIMILGSLPDEIYKKIISYINPLLYTKNKLDKGRIFKYCVKCGEKINVKKIEWLIYVSFDDLILDYHCYKCNTFNSIEF